MRRISYSTFSILFALALPSLAQADTGEALRDVYNRLMIVLTEGVPMVSEDDINDMAGNPWTLEPATAKKVALLQPKLRFRLYMLMSERMSNVELAPSPQAPYSIFRVSPETAELLVNRVTSTTLGHFNTNEMVDLSVFLLSRLPFFPKDEPGWAKLRTQLVKQQVMIFLAAALALAGTDKATFTYSDMFLKLMDGKIQIGWYGRFKDLGVSWHPTFAAGLRTILPGFEVSTGASHKFNAKGDEAVDQLEVTLRDHWLSKFTLESDWEVAFALKGGYALKHNDPYQQGKFSLDADLFARKQKFLEKEALSLLTGGTLSTQFSRKMIGSAFVGVEDSDWGLTGLVGASVVSAPDQPREFKAQLFLAGTWGDDTPKSEMMNASSRLREYLWKSQDQDKADRAVWVSLVGFGTGSLSAAAEKQLLSELVSAEKWRAQRKVQLKKHLDRYLAAREGYFNTTGKTAKLLKPTDGPLSPEDLVQILDYLGN